MITLITGVPGAGKTLNTLKLVQEEWGDSDRPIYYRGIRDLTLPWTELTDEQMRTWFDYEDGSIFVIDEIQQVFPRRSPNQPAPEAVSRLDTHRHRGFDFYIITQKPKNFDFEARGYVGRHLHFERAFGREATRQLEWQSACDDPGDYHKRQDAQVSRVNFDKKYYQVYKSAEVHTHKKRIPKKFWAFVAAIIFTLSAGAYAFSNIMGRTEQGVETTEAQPSAFRPDQFDDISTTPSLDGHDQVKELEKLAFLERHQPRIEGLDWTAPVYDEVREVKTFPRPQCMRSERTQVCNCYTQQATPLEVPPEVCNNIVDGGWFNPYQEEGGELARAGDSAPTTPPTSSDPVVPGTPRVVFVGRQSATESINAAVPQASTYQPGGAYRNPSRTAPLQPRQP